MNAVDADAQRALLRYDHQLCAALYTASRLMQRAYRPTLDALGVTYPQYLVMLVLWDAHHEGAPSPSVSELGDRLRLDSGTLTPLLKRLTERGFVERRRSDDDERRVHVALTAAGLALETDAVAVPMGMICRLTEVSGDMADLMPRLRRLIEALES